MASGIDLEKLTPAPWRYQEESDRYTHIVRAAENLFLCQLAQDLLGPAEANARFIALARNAFDVMMRRNWGAILGQGGWFVFSTSDDIVKAFLGRKADRYSDPFTALVEADRWYRENVESPDARRHGAMSPGRETAARPSLAHGDDAGA